MLGRLRDHFEPLKTRVAAPLARTGLPPLAFTLLGLPLGLGAGLLLYQERPALALAMAIAASLTDFVDGAVARAQQRTSLMGNYLEAVVDRMVELILLLALALHDPLPAAFAIAASMFVSYCKPRVALVIPTDNRDWPGIADHADRMVLVVAAFAFQPFGYGAPVLWGLTLLAGVGAAQRLMFACRLISESETP